LRLSAVDGPYAAIVLDAVHLVRACVHKSTLVQLIAHHLPGQVLLLLVHHDVSLWQELLLVLHDHVDLLIRQTLWHQWLVVANGIRVHHS
jgi:hypothetical protein